MELFVRLIKNRSCWLKACVAGLWLMSPGYAALLAQNLDTFNVGSGVPANNNAEPLLNYTPPINATNFFNDVSSQFSWNLGVSGIWSSSLYPANGWNVTLNFTNLGEMDSSTGFNFYKYQGEGGNFYNAGPINCGTSASAVVLTIATAGTTVVSSGYGGINVFATNIFDSGAISIGPDGLARFTGSKIDFTRGSVSIQGSSAGLTETPAVVTATGQTARNTNDWVPTTYLTQTSAIGLMNATPLELALANSTPYFDIQPADNTGTNWIVNMVFLEDNSFDVTPNVYFDAGLKIVHIEWAGSYTDPATDQTTTHYLYMDDNYVTGSNTNILKYGENGNTVPANYTFYTSPTPLYNNPAPISTSTTNFDWLDSDDITNNVYSYVSAEIEPTTVSLVSPDYGPIALTNIAGRVEINAAKELNLQLAAMSGMNYLKLNSPVQFDYDGQSPVSAPYADLYLGSTNGSMIITNLVEASIPSWSGTVQAWTTSWNVSNTVPAFTNYNIVYRVVLVASQLDPTTASQEQDFTLHSSNNVVLSDTLNIFRTFSMNCTNLTLTYNGSGNGAASLDGELNLDSAAISWATSLPRLRCLANNGTIITLNQTTFGSVASPYLSLVNSGTIENTSGTIINSADFENYGYFYAGTGLFSVQSLTTTMDYGTIEATAGTFSDTASSMVIAGTYIDAGKSFTLTATNLLTDGGIPGIWSLGGAYSGVSVAPGLSLPIKPVAGDLLGTAINYIAVSNTLIQTLWAGQDRGAVNAGFNNNVAVGQLILDAQGPAPRTQFYFGGPGASNAIYVDDLILEDNAATLDVNNNVKSLAFSNNFVIYYAQATINGQSVAEKLNGANNNHLRWVSSYAGNYSSVYIVYPDGTTYAINAALAQSSTLDSDRDGTVNNADPTPVLEPTQVTFTAGFTNRPPPSVRLQWPTIPLAANYVYYTTNLLSPNWQPFTNFNYFYWLSNNVEVAVTNAAHAGGFVSPQPYVSTVHPADNWETTNVWIYDALTNVPHFYKLMVQPN